MAANFRPSGTPRINAGALVMSVVAGEITHPVGRASPYRIGNDGRARILPGPGGIVLSHRVGDGCVGLAGDHVEPGAAVRNNRRQENAEKDALNRALLTYACVGNRVRVVSGPCAGQLGRVTGKHGGVDHLLVDFPPRVLRRLGIADRVQVYACGLGLRFLDHPRIVSFNCSPGLIRRWGLRDGRSSLGAPVTHLVPAAIMGSGVGRGDSVRGDYDLQLFDSAARRRFGLETLRFGDFVAICGSDARFGRAYRSGAVTIGVVVHGDSTVSGHGPGVLALLTGPEGAVRPLRDPEANLAAVLGLGAPRVPARRPTLLEQERTPGPGSLPRAPARALPPVRT